MPQLYFNGEFLDNSQSIFFADSRAVKYGDGCFESIAFFNGVAPLLELHILRLIKAAQLLQLQLPPNFSLINISTIISELVIRNNYKNARIRLQLLRNGGGFYTPMSNDSSILITMNSFSQNHYLHTEESAVVFPETFSSNKFSSIKSTSALPYIMAALFAAEKEVEHSLLFNQHYRITESHHSNIFIIKDHVVFTPSISEGCINGVMRNFLIKQLILNGKHEVNEGRLELEAVLQADEIFLTNAVRGIQSIKKLNDKEFKSQQGKQISDFINQKLGLQVA